MNANKQVLFIFIVICLLFPLFANRTAGLEGEIRVGIFPFKPINFIDENDRTQGVYPDLLREITKDEDWTVTFVEGS